MGRIRLGKRTENRNPFIRDLVPLSQLSDIVFGGWDIFPDNAYEAAAHAGVLSREDLAELRPHLEAVRPMPGVFDPAYVKKLSGTYVKQGTSKRALAEQLMDDIATFKRDNGLARCVAVWCASTEIYQQPSPVMPRSPRSKGPR